MATTLGTENNATPQVNPNVVPPKSKGGRMSLARQKEKKDITEHMVANVTSANFVTKFGVPATVVPPTAPPPLSLPTVVSKIPWTAQTKDFPDESDHDTSVENCPIDTPVTVPVQGPTTHLAVPGPSSVSLSSGLDEDTMRSDTSSNEATDSSKFYETEGTPQVWKKLTFKYFMKEKSKSQRSDMPPQEVQPMEQDVGSGRRKRSAGKKGKPHQQKLRKGTVSGKDANAKPTDSSHVFGGVAVPPQFWKTVPLIYAPDTPEIGQAKRIVYQGEVPSSPEILLAPVAPLSCQQELRNILADFVIPEELATRLTSLMTKVDLILSQNVRFQTDLASQVRSLQESVSTIQARMAAPPVVPPLSFAEKFSGLKPIFTPLPQQTDPVPVAGPSRAVEQPWTVVTAKRKAPVTQEPVQPKKAAVLPPPLPNPQARPVRLPPRPSLPTVVVKPIGEETQTSANLKSMLEANIHPLALGVRVITC
ncbi:hypothetical protein AVEN_7957-1 [Araneus ventricosus]|uniref:Uncharacterized protein n=1 Tax=Araneus ventricosus TaxID=182803 RepID=A0A4Y2D1U4_ARAVE|nr:hypothetical protein AVEN_7957-1 [Araneus ventricosus]